MRGEAWAKVSTKYIWLSGSMVSIMRKVSGNMVGKPLSIKYYFKKPQMDNLLRRNDRLVLDNLQ